MAQFLSIMCQGLVMMYFMSQGLIKPLAVRGHATFIEDSKIQTQK